jgi:hypothetical protein
MEMMDQDTEATVATPCLVPLHQLVVAAAVMDLVDQAQAPQEMVLMEVLVVALVVAMQLVEQVHLGKVVMVEVRQPIRLAVEAVEEQMLLVLAQQMQMVVQEVLEKQVLFLAHLQPMLEVEVVVAMLMVVDHLVQVDQAVVEVLELREQRALQTLVEVAVAPKLTQ